MFIGYVPKFENCNLKNQIISQIFWPISLCQEKSSFRGRDEGERAVMKFLPPLFEKSGPHLGSRCHQGLSKSECFTSCQFCGWGATVLNFIHSFLERTPLLSNHPSSLAFMALLMWSSSPACAHFSNLPRSWIYTLCSLFLFIVPLMMIAPLASAIDKSVIHQREVTKLAEICLALKSHCSKGQMKPSEYRQSLMSRRNHWIH